MYFSTLFVTAGLATASGNAPGKSIWAIESGEELVLLIALITLLVGMVLVGFLCVYLLIMLKAILAPAGQATEKRTFWQYVTGLWPLAQERELVMAHAYDGIHELDNPTPPWFMGLFYGSIGFAVIYLLLFHVAGVGQLSLAEYNEEVQVAEVAREAYIQKVAGSINENTVKLVGDAKSLDAGKVLFSQKCVACHGQQAQGGVGPNLTDEYWLHGGSVKAVYHTINEGVPEKGMMSWKSQLNPLQVQQVASYILSLQGSKPVGAKEPQGEKMVALK
ncbi:cbb3-type cytochrome c oxidase N-terminal domain-containing protein [Fibrella sp. WM1]|uniref:cbb3-type cytochrome c oxidase N-terminal domain-containing protein n=1 Tax=Fibrella musci TaxID=3242485 RepID=UPI003521BF06